MIPPLQMNIKMRLNNGDIRDVVSIWIVYFKYPKLQGKGGREYLFVLFTSIKRLNIDPMFLYRVVNDWQQVLLLFQ